MPGGKQGDGQARKIRELLEAERRKVVFIL
jgi:hypothetical protein